MEQYFIKLLKELKGRERTYPVGTIFVAELVGVISPPQDALDVGDEVARSDYVETALVVSITDRRAGYTMILPNCANGLLYEECDVPASKVDLVA